MPDDGLHKTLYAVTEVLNDGLIVVAAMGILLAMVAVYAWAFEPVNDPDDGEQDSSY